MNNLAEDHFFYFLPSASASANERLFWASRQERQKQLSTVLTETEARALTKKVEAIYFFVWVGLCLTTLSNKDRLDGLIETLRMCLLGSNPSIIIGLYITVKKRPLGPCTAYYWIKSFIV